MSGPSTAAPKPKAAPKAAPTVRPPRRRAREFAVQALYQWLLGQTEPKTSPQAVDEFTRGLDGFGRADSVHYDALLHGCIAEQAALDALIGQYLDRRPELVSPIEHAVLLIGSYELQHALDVPAKVVINESVELAKAFGGPDGHKFVNGVIDKVAAQLRPDEMKPKSRKAA
jgi:N utilization substance protein B